MVNVQDNRENDFWRNWNRDNIKDLQLVETFEQRLRSLLRYIRWCGRVQYRNLLGLDNYENSFPMYRLFKNGFIKNANGFVSITPAGKTWLESLSNT